MKYFFSFLFFLFSTLFCGSQNLVPNGDFELFTSCPTGAGQLNLANPWIDPTGATSDYFNSCAPIASTASVPNGTLGFWQNARSGSAYAGLFAMQNIGSEYREYIQIQLTNPMDTGLCYDVAFYVNLMNSVKKGCNNMGAYISKTAITASPPNVLNYIPQILLTGNSPIIDTVNWIKISGIYTALGGEKYITIGNFNNDSSTVTQIIDAASPYDIAYYYIEDVSVKLCSGIGVSEYFESSPFALFPNPNNGNMFLNYSIKPNDKASIKIYDAIGKLIQENNLDSSNNQLQINSKLNKGIYFYQIIINDQSVKNGRIIIVQ